jgi:hypothetical protein
MGRHRQPRPHLPRAVSMNAADTMRHAATLMREQEPSDTLAIAVADLLDEASVDWPEYPAALAVARAYLEESA